MNKKILLLVLVIVLAVASYFLLSGNKNNKSDLKSDNISNNGAVTVISMTDEKGFSPSTINIKQGETVVFKNIGAQDHWPASNIHPTHSVYSGTSLREHCPDTTGTAFDSCERIASGNSWSFVFNKKGSWRYHDHLYPTFTGTINVQ